LIAGNLGRAVIKVSAVAEAHRVVEAPCIVFNDQNELLAAFERGELERDFVAVVRFQGPHANGMPELHKLTPTLSVLQGRGFHVALVTDGRMSGASGKVPAAIHIVPEAAAGGVLSRLVDGDIIRLDATAGELTVKLSEQELADRPVATHTADSYGMGRELFASLRGASTSAEEGAMTFGISICASRNSSGG
ncbi:MAG: phosphogluconate dehydratase, partial [Myxococcota bacterium]